MIVRIPAFRRKLVSEKPRPYELPPEARTTYYVQHHFSLFNSFIPWFALAIT
jgi:hypothetical protein